MSPPVLFEILSGPGLTPQAEQLICQLPRLEVTTGFWERTGKMRRALLKRLESALDGLSDRAELYRRESRVNRWGSGLPAFR
jgi:hypothetical protein